jgi:hypothetical protein
VLCVLSTLAMWAASPRKIILVAGMARVTNS